MNVEVHLTETEIYKLKNYDVIIIRAFLHQILWFSFKIKADLGYQPTDLKKTVIDMAYNLIDSGFIKKTPQYEEAMKKKAES